MTVGFHRLLTHGSFRCHRLTRAAFAALGSAAAEGPVIDWVATHRKHHQFSDAEGDPHSPHVGHGPAGAARSAGSLTPTSAGCSATWRWPTSAATPRTCSADSWLRFVNNTFVLWVIAGLAAAFGLGVALTGNVAAWPDRAAVGWRRSHLLHAPRDVQHQLAVSLLRPPGLRHHDESRNLAWLAIPTWGEAWHNNHHAFPCSYRHGLRRWQIDPSAAIIRMMEMSGLAWDVVRVSPERRDNKALAGAA